MSTIQKILFFFILPIIAPMILPPEYFSVDGGSIIFLAVLLGASALILGPFLYRGRTTALTLAIFVQGINIVIRLMMFFPNLKLLGHFQSAWLVASILSMALSMYLLIRLDRPDVRVTMVT